MSDEFTYVPSDRKSRSATDSIIPPRGKNASKDHHFAVIEQYARLSIRNTKCHSVLTSQNQRYYHDAIGSFLRTLVVEPIENARPQSYKQLAKMTDTFSARIWKAANERKKDLDLSALQLTKLDPLVGALQSLTWLHLNHNSLTSLPPEIGYLHIVSTC